VEKVMNSMEHSRDKGGHQAGSIAPRTRASAKNQNVDKKCFKLLSVLSAAEVDSLLLWYAGITADVQSDRPPTKAETIERSSALHHAFLSGLSACAGHESTPADLRKADELIESLGLKSHGPS
jgi:hypothetical protein